MNFLRVLKYPVNPYFCIASASRSPLHTIFYLPDFKYLLYVIELEMNQDIGGVDMAHKSFGCLSPPKNEAVMYAASSFALAMCSLLA